MVLRFNIRRLKGLVWLACTLALLWAGWTFFEIYTAKSEGAFAARTPLYFRGLVQPEDESRTGRQPKAFYPESRYRALWETLVDGSIRPKDGPPDEVPLPEVEQKPKLPELESIVSIGVILASSTPGQSFIALNYQQPGNPPGGAQAAPTGKASRLHLSEGDPLRPPYDAPPYNGRVVSIEPQQVVFRWGDEDVVVTPKLESTGEGIPLSVWSPNQADDLTAGIDEAPEVTTQLGPGTWIVGNRDLDRARENPQTFLEQELRVRTVTPRDGERTTLELTDVPDGSLAKQFGLAPKDRLISVNGVPMSSLSSAIHWFKQNSDLPVYEIVYETLGQQKTLTFVVK